MEGERLRSKSRPKSKGNRSPNSKKLTNVASKSQEIENHTEITKQYFLTLRSALNTKLEAVDFSAELTRILKLCKKHPTDSIATLCHLYHHRPSLFYQHAQPSKSQSVRHIFSFLEREIQFYEAYPLMEQERVVVINENFLKWLGNRSDPLLPEQLAKMNEMAFRVMTLVINGEKDRIIENMLYLILKIPTTIANNCQNQEERLFCENIVRDLMKDIARLLDKNHKITQQTTQKIVQFHQQTFKMLIHNVKVPSDIYPFFDFATCIFTSKNGETCKQIMTNTFTILRNLIDGKEQVRESRQEGSIDQRSIEESEHKINAVLLVSSILKFDTVLETESLQRKAAWIKEITVLTLLVFKAQLIRLIDELEKLEKSSVPASIIRGMFEMATFCNKINHQNTLIPIIKRIQACKDLSSYLVDDKLLPSSPKDADPLEALAKGLQKVLFELMCRIQKSLCHYNLQIFMDLFIQSPYTFRSEHFIEKTFQNQHEEVILKLMRGLATKWLLADIKIFDFSFYLLHLIRKCIADDCMNVLGRFIKLVTIPQLARLNLLIFKLSFQEDAKKYHLPESSSRMVQLASLTSAGFRERFAFVNQIMPIFSEQLVWRQLIAHFFQSQHFIIVKSFYNVINHQLAFNVDSITQLISIFEGFIDQQQIDDVHATFHLLHCILFQNKHNDEEVPLRKCEARLFEIVITKSKQILNMHDLVSQRRRLAISSMSMSNQMVTENMRCLDRLKRINSHFMSSLHRWLQSLSRIDSLLPPKHSYEQVIEILLSYCKDNDYREFHQVRYLSHFCSEKYFSNILSSKMRAKIEREELLSCHHLLALKDIIRNLMNEYADENLENDYCIKEQQILNYYSQILKAPVTALNQRELLKSKMIVLSQIAQLTIFFQEHPHHKLYHFYTELYHTSIRSSLVQIALQNPEYVSKHTREFIMQLKVVAMTKILVNLQTDFEVLSREEIYTLIYQTCFHKHMQIRFMMINILVSRFKHEGFKKFLSEKYEIAAFITTIAVFDVNPIIKSTARRIAQTYKNAGKDNNCLGLVVLLHCLKHLLAMTYRHLIKEQYFICIDSFLTNFHQIWLVQKQWEYVVYAFASRFIQQAQIAFIIAPHILALRSHIQTYYIEKVKSDFHLEHEIKVYMKKEDEFSFQFPPDEPIPSFRQKLIDNLMYSLPFRVCAKIKQLIEMKQRPSRILKYKKDIYIDWKLLEKNGIVQLLKQKSERNIVLLEL